MRLGKILSGPLFMSAVYAAAGNAAHAAGPTILYAQSNHDTVADIYVNGVATVCRPGAVSISQWFANKYASDGKDVPILWNVGDFTGFYPTNNATTQLGLTNGQYGGTAIQVQGGRNGWQIETTTAVPNPAASNPAFIAGIIGAHTLCDGAGHSTSMKPFARPYTVLTYSIDLQVPYSNSMWGTVNTAAQMFYFTDSTANLGFWYSFADYSSVDQAESVQYDVGTDSAIIGAINGSAGQFSTDFGDAKMARSTWKGNRTFRAAVTATNLRNAIDAIKAAAAKSGGNLSKYQKLSEDPSVYTIGGGILDTEVARVSNRDGGMGLSSQNAQIALWQGGSGCGGSTTIAWTCGNGRPNANWVDSGGGCYQYNSGVPCHDRILGNVDSVQATSGGGVLVTGWACALGVNQSLGVRIYAGSGAGSAAIGGGAAWAANDASTAAACLDPSGTPHRFSIVIDPAQAAAHRGQPLYVYGIYGSQSGAVSNSGTYTLP